MKNGTTFEQLTAEIFEHLRSNKDFETVQHNIQLPSPDGPRQIDVLLKGRIGPIEILTIVECKDYSKIVTVGEVDALHSKLTDVKGNKAILVARKGFSKTAISKARRLGITLCTAQQAKSERWPFQLQIPFVIEELSCEEMEISFEFVAIENMQGVSLDAFSGTPLPKITADYWNETEIPCNDGITLHRFSPWANNEPTWALTTDGREFPIQDFHINMKIKRGYYFGYLNDFESTKCLEFLDPPKRHIIFDPGTLSDYRTKLARYSKKTDIPKIDGSLGITVKLMQNPKATLRKPI